MIMNRTVLTVGPNLRPGNTVPQVMRITLTRGFRLTTVTRHITVL